MAPPVYAEDRSLRAPPYAPLGARRHRIVMRNGEGVQRTAPARWRWISPQGPYSSGSQTKLTFPRDRIRKEGRETKARSSGDPQRRKSLHVEGPTSTRHRRVSTSPAEKRISRTHKRNVDAGDALGYPDDLA